jgi:hypothetical protein
VAAFECRSETESVLTTETFNSKQMNWAALGEFILAVLVTQMDGFRRLLGTTELNISTSPGHSYPPSPCSSSGSSASSSPDATGPSQRPRHESQPPILTGLQGGYVANNR